jgi:hypothetical protein
MDPPSSLFRLIYAIHLLAPIHPPNLPIAVRFEQLELCGLPADSEIRLEVDQVGDNECLKGGRFTGTFHLPVTARGFTCPVNSDRKQGAEDFLEPHRVNN